MALVFGWNRKAVSFDLTTELTLKDRFHRENYMSIWGQPSNFRPKIILHWTMSYDTLLWKSRGPCRPCICSGVYY